jgi:transcriptional regulator with XRE-family HTH domain
MSPRHVIAENLRALMARWSVQEDQRFKKLRTASGIANGTLERILKAQVDTQVDKLELLADALDIEPWELLVPPDRRDALHHMAQALRAAVPSNEHATSPIPRSGKRSGTHG